MSCPARTGSSKHVFSHPRSIRLVGFLATAYIVFLLSGARRPVEQTHEWPMAMMISHRIFSYAKKKAVDGGDEV